MIQLSLITPSIDYKETYLEAIRGFKDEGLVWFNDVDVDELDHNFECHIESLMNRPNVTMFWGIVEDRFAGQISVRHELTPDLKRFGGNIGYETAPAFRNQGVASEMLRKVLPFAKTIGLIEVLLTCDDTNIASIKVIEKNGGVLKEKKLLEVGQPLKRYYWIPLN